jgi:hypothetical protein
MKSLGLLHSPSVSPDPLGTRKDGVSMDGKVLVSREVSKKTVVAGETPDVHDLGQIISKPKHWRFSLDAVKPYSK